MLNDKYFLSDYLSGQKKQLLSEIERYEVTDDTDVGQLTSKFVERFTIHPIVLRDPIPSEPSEITRDRTNEWGEKFKQKAFQITVKIPFEGSGILFHCKPSRSTVKHLGDHVRFESNHWILSVVLKELDVDKYNAEVNKFVSDLSVNLPTLHAEIAPWNNSLENMVSSAFEQRRQISSKKFDFMDKIGLKLNPKADTFTALSVAKKIIPTPVSDTTKNVNKAQVPILQEEVYRDIIEVLYNLGKAIERKPALYFKKHEEDLRDIFLLFLETRYEATSGVGEAFNKKGKTDILLKYSKDGSNIFVAECKFWKGQKKSLEAIDQLLGYLTHRDSKTALMLFIDQKEINTVITTIKEEIKSHPNFNRHVKDAYDSSLSYLFTLPGDIKTIVQVEIMFFHFPK